MPSSAFAVSICAVSASSVFLTFCNLSGMAFRALSMRVRLPLASLPSSTRWLILPLRVRMKSLPKFSTVSDIEKPR